MTWRRVRGALLRLVRRRPLAVVVGGVLVAAAAWLDMSGRYTAWWVDGASLVVGGTGAAVLWSGLTGVRPDWVDGSPGDRHP